MDAFAFIAAIVAILAAFAWGAVGVLAERRQRALDSARAARRERLLRVELRHVERLSDRRRLELVRRQACDVRRKGRTPHDVLARVAEQAGAALTSLSGSSQERSS